MRYLWRFSERAEAVTRERPYVVARCRRCKVTRADVDANRVIVSSRGYAHFAGNYGDTRCGQDATGARWWWPE